MVHTSMPFCFRKFWSSVFFWLTPSAFQCASLSFWSPVTLLCPPLAIGEPESQSVAWGEPLWGWGPGAILTWLRSIRTTPHRSESHLHGHMIKRCIGTRFSPCHEGLYLPTSKDWCFFVRVVPPRPVACQGWWICPTQVCPKSFPSHRGNFIWPHPPSQPFGSFLLFCLFYCWVMYTCVCPLTPSQLLGVFSSSSWSTVGI